MNYELCAEPLRITGWLDNPAFALQGSTAKHAKNRKVV